MIEYIGRYEDKEGTQRDVFLCEDPRGMTKDGSTWSSGHFPKDCTFFKTRKPLLIDQEAFATIEGMSKKVGHQLHGIFLMMKMQEEMEKKNAD